MGTPYKFLALGFTTLILGGFLVTVDMVTNDIRSRVAVDDSGFNYSFGEPSSGGFAESARELPALREEPSGQAGLMDFFFGSPAKRPSASAPAGEERKNVRSGTVSAPSGGTDGASDNGIYRSGGEYSTGEGMGGPEGDGSLEEYFSGGSGNDEGYASEETEDGSFSGGFNGGLSAFSGGSAPLTDDGAGSSGGGADIGEAPDPSRPEGNGPRERSPAAKGSSPVPPSGADTPKVLASLPVKPRLPGPGASSGLPSSPAGRESGASRAMRQATASAASAPKMSSGGLDAFRSAGASGAMSSASGGASRSAGVFGGGGSSAGPAGASGASGGAGGGSGGGAGGSGGGSGGAPPAASPPRKVDTGGSGGGAGGGSGGGAAAPAGSGASAAGAPAAMQAAGQESASGIIYSVVMEKQEGLAQPYLSQAGLSEPLDGGALTPGGIVPDSGEDPGAEGQGAEPQDGGVTGAGTEPESGAAGEGEKDPPSLDGLSQDRREELKGDIHVFLGKVEEKYGDMSDIHIASCTLTPEICEGHGITGDYLGMFTAQGSSVYMGLKYVDGRWRGYVLDFRDK